MSVERRIAITGTNGLVGGALAEAFHGAGWRVLRLVRSPDARFPGLEQTIWSPGDGRIEAERVRACAAVVHLAGANIAEGRWTTERRKELRDSRILSTRLLARTLADAAGAARVFACASAVGFYGDAQDALVDEASPVGAGFLAGLCREWEEAAQEAERPGLRVARVRLGAVLARDAGLLGKVVPIFRAGAGGRVGSGRQWLSWIALPDLVRVFQRVVDAPDLAGPFNAVAPHPVRNAEFTAALAAHLGRPAVVPAPAFALRLAFGALADEVLLAGQRAAPRRLLEAGFPFALPTLPEALRAVLPET